MDNETLAIAESLPVADLELETAARVDRGATAGRPDSGFATYARVFQFYEPIDGDPEPVLVELRQLVEQNGWNIEEDDETYGWRTEEREIEGRVFSLRAGGPPDGSQVTLWLEESRRDTSR